MGADPFHYVVLRVVPELEREEARRAGRSLFARLVGAGRDPGKRPGGPEGPPDNAPVRDRR